jgi:hypothetical protein
MAAKWRDGQMAESLNGKNGSRMAGLLNGGRMAGWYGRMAAEWRTEWQNGGRTAGWSNGGQMAEWSNGEDGGMADGMAEWWPNGGMAAEWWNG